MTCHRALLGYHSEFFDNALYGKFTEGSPDAVMNLPVMMSSMYGIHPMDIYRRCSRVVPSIELEFKTNPT
jgi:hypothetical protein